MNRWEKRLREEGLSPLEVKRPNDDVYIRQERKAGLVVYGGLDELDGYSESLLVYQQYNLDNNELIDIAHNCARVLNALPRHIRAIALKLMDDQALTKKDIYQLRDWRKRLSNRQMKVVQALIT